jgi:hypothetical protein
VADGGSQIEGLVERKKKQKKKKCIPSSSSSSSSSKHHHDMIIGEVRPPMSHSSLVWPLR